MSVPTRTAEQRTEALESALAARKERARLRAALKARETTAGDVIRRSHDNPVWGAVKVVWLLECVPGIGSARAERIMTSLGIARSRRVQGLGDRQRAALIIELEGAA